MPTEIAVKIISRNYEFLSGTAAIVPSKNPAIISERHSSSLTPGFLSNELARALVAGASDQVSLPVVQGSTRKFRLPNSRSKLLVVLTDIALQRRGSGKIIHIAILHAGIFDVTQEVRERGVLEIVVPIKKITRIKVLDKNGRPAPDQWLSIWGSNEQPNRVAEVRSNQQGEFIILGTTPGHYIVQTDEGESVVFQVRVDDSGEEVEVTLQKQK